MFGLLQVLGLFGFGFSGVLEYVWFFFGCLGFLWFLVVKVWFVAGVFALRDRHVKSLDLSSCHFCTAWSFRVLSNPTTRV